MKGTFQKNRKAGGCINRKPLKSVNTNRGKAVSGAGTYGLGIQKPGRQVLPIITVSTV